MLLRHATLKDEAHGGTRALKNYVLMHVQGDYSGNEFHPVCNWVSRRRTLSQGELQERSTASLCICRQIAWLR